MKNEKAMELFHFKRKKEAFDRDVLRSKNDYLRGRWGIEP